MAIFDRFTAAYRGFTKTNNSRDDLLLSRKFLKYGSNKPLVQDWSQVKMTDQDLYSGYPYAAINNRANGVARLAEMNLKTDALPKIMQEAKAKREDIIHPYLTVIDESLTFDNDKFWYDISTYLDLEGVYYILALRNKIGERAGDVQEFKLLNPYDIKRIINKDTGELGGYIENRDGLQRELPVHMIIEIRKLNPFSREDPYSMIDAARENQFTLKQAGDYTRHSLKNNMAAPGIISTDVLLDPQQFSNFVSRVTNQEKGLPLFGNGAGAITWDSMQIDMDKAALDKINEINRQALFAVSGVGKTMMSIEESGTTRDTARAQKEIFIENHVIPQLKLIVSALNQDYKRYYIDTYKTNKYRIYIDNPLGSDRDAEMKDVEIRDATLDLYDKLVGMGYKRELASRYAAGEITLEELGEPTEEPRPNPVIEAAMLKSGQDPNAPQIPPGKGSGSTAKKKESLSDKDENKSGNPFHDKKGRFTTGPGGGGSSSDASPKGLMSRADADEATKNSKYKKVVYHGTSSGAAKQIKKEGFELDHKGAGRWFGNGVYLASDSAAGREYGLMADGSKGQVFGMKIDVRNPYVEGKKGNKSVTELAMDYGEKKGLWSADVFETGAPDMKSWHKATAAVVNEKLKTHDAFVMSTLTGDIVVVKDPASIKLFSELNVMDKKSLKDL